MNGPSPINYSNKTALIILILAGFYLGIIAITNKNYLIEILSRTSPNNYKLIIRFIYVVFGLASLYLLVVNPLYTFLPFLDKTVLPPSLLLLSEQADTNTQIKVYAPGAIKVAYWAAKEDKNEIIDNPYDAYSSYENVGVALVKDEYATLKLKCPSKYKVVNSTLLLPQHVHFRMIYENGVLSEVKTMNLEKNCSK
jgi:uncharacterized membrane protein YuzA (DUF378 family)